MLHRTDHVSRPARTRGPSFHRARRPVPAFGLVLGIALVLCSSACDNTVRPFVEGSDRHFALFGLLTTTADTQFVRVQRIRRTGEDPPEATLDAVVTSTHLETGHTVAWRDSLVRTEDGSAEHLFYAPFTPAPGGTYRVDVEGRDGRTTSARTRIPEAPPFTVSAPSQADFGEWVQYVLLEDVDVQPRMTMRYEVARADSSGTRVVVIPYDLPGEPRSDGWLLAVQLERDYRMVRTRLNVPFGDTAVVFLGLGMEIERFSPEWTEPEAELNITNGHGFFGAVAHFARSWALDTAVVRDIGYLLPP